ncbi:MAG: hexokinase [Treponema sp.]|jgi:hexokinase|nr:hexokinase [Treponema sp.]
MKTDFNPKLIDDFAHYHGFHYDQCDANMVIRDFCTAMDRGLKDQTHSLPMIPTYLAPKWQPSTGKKVIALDVGGTNIRVARIKFDDTGNHIVEDERKMTFAMKARTADEFFSTIASFCEPFFDGSVIEGIGFCFSYPMEMTGEGDGVLISFSKEMDLVDLIGKPIGKGLCDALSRRKVKVPERIVLLNDTVSTLLCGLCQIPARIPSKLAVPGKTLPEKMAADAGPAIGFILGTGFNIAYCETNIPKINFESKTEPQIVICESGCMEFRYRGPLDLEFDAGTKLPGMSTTEKLMSGAYLGPLSLHVLKQAVKDGVLRFEKSAELLAMENLETKDLNALLQAPLVLGGPLGKLFNSGEDGALRSLVYIESILTERAALVAAASLTAVINHCGCGRDPFSPVRIAVEGTTFSVYHFLEESLRARLSSMLNRDSPCYYIMECVEQASLFGAAAAALF